MAVFEGSKAGSKYLGLLFKTLQIIPPTSVEAERAFSSLGLFATKVRNSLNDESLDKLTFFKAFFEMVFSDMSFCHN